MVQLRRCAALGAVLLLTQGCWDPFTVDDVSVPWVETDSLRYTLRYTGVFVATVQAVFRNESQRTLYLHRMCGQADQPARQLVRADGNPTEIALLPGQPVCGFGESFMPPIAVPPGGTYAESFQIWGWDNSTQPPVPDIEERRGRFRLVYLVQFSSRAEGFEPVNLVPLGWRTSNEFEVEVPANYCNVTRC